MTRKEGHIDQTRHPDEGRSKTLPQGDTIRRLGRAAIIIAALLLVALTWIGARDAIRAHRTEVRARVQAELLAKALTLEDQLRRELLSLDRHCAFWNTNGSGTRQHFDLAARASQVVVINDVSLQLFISDAQGIVRSSSRPAIVGTDISKRDYFIHEASLPADEGKMFMGELIQGQVTRLWQINLARRLDNPDGSFRRRDRRFVRHQFVHAILSRNRSLRRWHHRRGQHARRRGLDTGRPGRDPAVISIAKSPLLAAMRQSAEGSWTGASGLDDADRMYAFATVPDQDLKVVVGLDRDAGAALGDRLGDECAAVHRRHHIGHCGAGSAVAARADRRPPPP